MSEIIPAIMPKKFSDIEWGVGQVVGAVKMVQLDIMDGKFVKNTSWPYGTDDAASFAKILNEEEGLPEWEKIDYELDLMIADADKEFEKLMKLSPKRVVFHIEAMQDFRAFLDNLEPYFKEHIEIGLAINNATPIEMIEPFISEIAFVQCMGIDKIGYQGNPFDERVIERVSYLREKYPTLTISVDGAVDLETAPLLLDAGADRLVIGSAIFKGDDIRGMIQEFKSM